MLKPVCVDELPRIYQQEFRPEAIRVVFEGSTERIDKRSYYYDGQKIDQALLRPLGVPMSYLDKCKNPRIVENIIQERAETIVNDRLCILSTEDFVHSLSVKKREILQPQDVYAEICKIMDDLGWFDGMPPSLEFDKETLEVNVTGICGEMFQRPVSSEVGDILRSGFKIRSIATMLTSVLLEILRLKCLNGMTANEVPYNWQDSGTAESQLAFIQRSIPKAIGSLMGIVAKAQQMRAEPISADPLSIIKAHAKAMGLPIEVVPYILEAFNKEPEQSIYGVWNAFTRASTHDPRLVNFRRETSLSAGEFIRNFDMVEARLPKSVALSVGASILN